jgi:hypothetical protein
MRMELMGLFLLRNQVNMGLIEELHRFSQYHCFIGCRSIEHASFIDEEGINACLENGTWIVPTFLVGAQCYGVARSVVLVVMCAMSSGEHFKDKGSPTGAQDRTIALMVRLISMIT